MTSYLDRLIGDDIAQEAKRDETLRRTLGIVQGCIDRSVLERFQLFKLRQTLSYVAERSAFYRQLYGQLGFDPSCVSRISDLHLIPFTQPEHIASDPYRFACVPMGDISRIVTLASSGTTGKTKRILFTQADLQRIATLFAANTRQVIGAKKAVVQIMLPGRTALGQAHLLGKAIEMAGSIPIITGNADQIAGQIESIVKNSCTALVGYPFYLYRLTRLAGLNHDLASLGIEAIVTAGEPLPSAIKRMLEEAWKARIFSQYGLTEMGFNGGMGCAYGAGYHIHEADFIVEVVDPATGLPLKDGQEGELVITSIRREAMPLIRYRTGDITSVIPEPCGCGSMLKRIGAVRRLKGATVRIGSKEIDTACLDERLFSIPEIVEYRVAVKNCPDGLQLHFYVETAQKQALSPEVVRNAVESELTAQGITLQDCQGIAVTFVSSFNAAPKRNVFLDSRYHSVSHLL